MGVFRTSVTDRSGPVTSVFSIRDFDRTGTGPITGPEIFWLRSGYFVPGPVQLRFFDRSCNWTLHHYQWCVLHMVAWVCCSWLRCIRVVSRAWW